MNCLHASQSTAKCHVLQLSSVSPSSERLNIKHRPHHNHYDQEESEKSKNSDGDAAAAAAYIGRVVHEEGRGSLMGVHWTGRGW